MGMLMGIGAVDGGGAWWCGGQGGAGVVSIRLPPGPRSLSVVTLENLSPALHTSTWPARGAYGSFLSPTWG